MASDEAAAAAVASRGRGRRVAASGNHQPVSAVPGHVDVHRTERRIEGIDAREAFASSLKRNKAN